jgi:hypothetical protein
MSLTKQQPVTILFMWFQIGRLGWPNLMRAVSWHCGLVLLVFFPFSFSFSFFLSIYWEWCFGSWIYMLSFIYFIFKKCQKIKQKVCSYMFTCYVHTKSFHEKSTCRLACAKNKNGAKNKAFYGTCFIIFYTGHKQYSLRSEISVGGLLQTLY